jgi:hypothetical protein
MKTWVIASLAMVLATSALAAPPKFFVTVDSVGNCSVVEGSASTGAGKTALGQTGGYDSKDAASTFLKEVRQDTSKCKGVVE